MTDHEPGDAAAEEDSDAEQSGAVEKPMEDADTANGEGDPES